MRVRFKSNFLLEEKTRDIDVRFNFQVLILLYTWSILNALVICVSGRRSYNSS